MLKRILSLLLALMLPMCGAALAEENVYDLIENATYRIVVRTENGDETLGSGILFSDRKLLLTSAACMAEGDLYAIGTDGEYAIVGAEPVDASGAALLELASAATATPLHLASENAAGMAALFGTAKDGEMIVAPLNHVRSTLFRGQSAMVLSSSDGLLPGSFLTDEKGSLIGLCIAQQSEGLGEYIALDANGLYRALTRQQFAEAFLPAKAVWQEGLLTISWTDEEREDGVYIITVSGDDNQYYTFFEAAPDERSIELTVPPEHRYDFQVQWAKDAASAVEPVWGAMSECYIPGAAFTRYGFTQECSFVTRTGVSKPLNHIEQINRSLLMDTSTIKSLYVQSAYDVAEAVELPMTIELLAPDGQFYFESAVHTLSPDKETEDAFLLPLDDLLADCAEFSGGGLKTGPYRLRYSIAGAVGGEYAFTLSNAVQTEAPAPTSVADSGFISQLRADHANGAITLSWPTDAVPAGAAVTIFHMYAGNEYYVYRQVEMGENQTEIFTVPGRDTVVWAVWTMHGAAYPEPQNERDLILVPGAPEVPFTLNGFENQRLGLAPSADPAAGEKAQFLPEVPLTREILMDADTPLYFMTEDTYQVTENSDGHPMMLVLFTPEGLCFAYPLEYLFDVSLQSSDLWLTDISSLCRDYESLICDAWPAGHYQFLYCIDGQVAGEMCFTLE